MVVFIFSFFMGQFLSYKALKPVSNITDEVESMDPDDRDASFALINVANQFLAVDHSRAW